MTFNIKENLKKLPDSPGVYLHKDKLGSVIYVGKALSLKKRVRQYFQTYGQSTPKLRALVSQIAEFEYITCNTEMEALILECNLIKHYMPKYNVLLRDDKTYPYIKITNEPFPRLVKTREIKKDGARYFGPYSDVNAVSQTIELLNDTYKLKRCGTVKFPPKHTPCLNYHINQCSGICRGDIPKEEYGERIREIIAFLNGNTGKTVKVLKEEMNQASEKMEFEKAAKYRNYIEAIKSIKNKQSVSMAVDKDMDILIPIRSEKNVTVALFPVRNGKLEGRELFPLSADNYPEDSEIIESFIKQYYSKWSNVPPEILINVNMDQQEKEVLEDFLTDGIAKAQGENERHHKVAIIHPQKGKKKAFLNVAIEDAKELSKTLDQKLKAKEEKNIKLKEMLDTILTGCGYGIREDSLYRVEAYDISNTNGVDSVGAMVVFEGLKPIKKAYRRFKIKTIIGPDDYGSLKEMLRRRFKKAKENAKGFDILPDIILMDGGKGQVSSAEEVLRELELDIPVLGMEKDDKHRTSGLVASNNMRVDLKDYPLLFQYLGNVQEEVHRFAISYHHLLHKKNTIKSLLDDIPGIGPAKRNALLRHFESIENIKNASKEKLMECPNITEKNAEDIKQFFVDKTTN